MRKKFKDKFEALKLALTWTYKSSKSLTLTIFLVTIIGGLLTIIEPYVFKIIIDRLVGEDLTLVEGLGLSILGVLGIYGVARILQAFLWDIQVIIKRIHAQKLDHYSSKVLMEKVSSLDTIYFENVEYYDTVQKANQNMWRINEFFWEFTFFIGQLVSLIVIIAALLPFNYVIVLLIIGASIPSLFFIFRNTRTYWSAFDSFSPISRKANYYRNLMMDNPQAIKEIKLFNLKLHFLERFDKLIKEFVNKQEIAARKELFSFISIGLVEGLLSVLAAWLVIQSFMRGEISVGELTFFWALLFQFSEHARHMVRMIGEIDTHLTFLFPFVRLLGFQPKIKEVKNPIQFPKKVVEGIEFRNVTFMYPNAKRPALKNFNLTIKPGESIALVGENGSGKTTLVKLLTRLYDVDSGEILIDGINIKEYSLDSLYDNIGVIFQDFMKYEALIEENIAYGNLKNFANKDLIHKSAVKSEAWEFVKDLEKKYETRVGKTLYEEGIDLSIGQWQKIALARAFFKDAQILCLDEPTAAVDARAEYNLFKKFERLTRDKLALFISHRFSTVRMADKIVVIEKGKKIEEGSHSDLLRKRGRYSKLFKMQAEGYQDSLLDQ